MKHTTVGQTMRHGYWLLNVDNDQGLYSIARDIIMDIYDAAKELKGQLEDITYDEKCDTHKICGNWTQRDWNDINFNGIVKSWREE